MHMPNQHHPKQRRFRLDEGAVHMKPFFPSTLSAPLMEDTLSHYKPYVLINTAKTNLAAQFLSRITSKTAI